MFSKGAKWYADWMNSEGKRQRKAFATRLAAKRFEMKQKRERNPTRGARSAKP
jgi:hypothetical protein